MYNVFPVLVPFISSGLPHPFSRAPTPSRLLGLFLGGLLVPFSAPPLPFLPLFRCFPLFPGPPRLLSLCLGVPAPAFLAVGCLGCLSVLPLLVVSLGDVAVGLGPDGVVLLVLALPLPRPAFLLALVLLGGSVVGRARAVGASAGLSLLFVPSLVPRAAALLLLPGVGVAGMAV